MGLLGKYRIKKSIDTIISAPDSNNPETAQAIARLKEFDSATIPKLIEVLASTIVPAPLIDLLASFVCNDTLQLYVKELGHSDHRVVAGVTRLLSTSRNFNPNSLIEYFSNPKISTSALIQILTHHKDTLTGEAILGLLDIMNQDTRSVILRLLDEVATESIVSVLIPLTTADDWIMRLSIVRILGRFDTLEVQQTLVALLNDPHKSIRQTALGGLASSKNPANIGSICQLLRDPDLTVQSKAIEAVIQTNAPQTVQYLLELLQDDSEYVRRGAVEILNAIGDTSAIKDLLGALRDKDWWVRVRAADALGTIGGPAVIDAVLELIKDEDEFIRRCAVEILNTIPDDRAFNALVQALHDEDWWVRERAIDALTQLGDARAVPALLALLGKDAKTNGVAIKALAALGDASTLRPLLSMLQTSENGVPQEALQALVALATEQHAAIVQDAIQDVSQSATGSLKEAANASLKALIGKFGDQRSMIQARAPHSMRDGQQRQPAISAAEMDSCLASQDDLSQVQAAPRDLPRTPTTNGDNEVEAIIDADALQPEMVLANRYRVVQHIGRGAFGIVLLVEDTIVHEEIILKFLNPHLASTETIVQRFIHELRYTRKITHEHVIRIYEFLTFGKSYAISMEYFRSCSLGEELRTHGRFATEQALRIIQDICSGMSAAHQVQVIHRDLKPPNILINDGGLVKIVDFGLAAAVSHPDSRLTQTGFMVGTPTYMAPEQIRGEDIDARTDIYSLGIIMYELLTGRPPYGGRDAVSLIYQHVEGKVTPPAEINQDLSPALESIILKAMAVKPQQRFQSMDELHAAITTLGTLEGA